jgi:hypothetical protein
VWRVEVEYTWTKPAVCIEFELTGQDAYDPDSPLQEQLKDGVNGDPIPAAFNSLQRKYGVRSHTWTCSEQVDTNWFTTRTYNGELKISSPHTNIHDFRLLTVPPLVPGMKRESIDYRVSADKMTLQYTIVDKEVMVTPPADFKNININHSEGSDKFGATANVRLDIKISGNRGATRLKMLTYALAIADYKLQLAEQAAGAQNKFGVQVLSIEVAVSEGTHQDNSLTVSITAKKTYAERQQVPGQAGNGQWFGFVSTRMMRRINAATFSNTDDPAAPHYNNQLMQGNNTAMFPNSGPHFSGGINSVTCFHAVLAEACAEKLDFSSINDDTAGDVTRRGMIRDALLNDAPTTIPDAPVEILDTLPSITTPAGISTQHGQSMYGTYLITTDYNNNAMSVSLPSSETTATSTLGLPAAVFVRLGPAQWMKTVKITAERYGSPPRLPEPQDLAEEPAYVDTNSTAPSSSNKVNLKLVKFEPRTHAPQFSADMSGLIYRTDAVYVYAMDRPPAKLRFGVPDSHSASLNGQGPAMEPTEPSVISKYSPDMDDVLIPVKSPITVAQDAWQVNV